MSENSNSTTESTVQTSKGEKIIGVFRTLFVYLLAIAIVIGALLFAADRSPQKSLFGYRYYTILTPSMAPTYNTGDMVFVRLKNAADINKDDVITFNPSAGSDAYLTHRVTEKIDNYEGTGVTCFKTKGDANNAEDSFLIDESRVIGTVEFSVPKLGVIVRFVQLRWYFVAVLIVLIGIFFRLMKIYFSGNDSEEEQKAEEPPINTNP